MNQEKFLSSVVLGILIFLMAGCSDVGFSSRPSEERVVKLPDVTTTGQPADGGNHGGGASGVLQDTLKTMQPVFAVRGVACLMCHADIRANIITDFGYGQSYFMGGTASFDQAQSWYNDLASTWQTARQIKGTIFVPDVPASASFLSLIGSTDPNLSIKDAMLTPYLPNWNYDGDASRQAMVARVQPPVAGDPQVVAKQKIVIRAPTESELRALDPVFFANPSDVAFKRVGSSQVIQLHVQDNGRGPFVTNDPGTTLDCAGTDVLVNGNLVLRGLNAKAGGGCRFYVTGSVFIEDAITYTDPDAKPSVQITSSRVISMGISRGRLNHRLKEDARGLELRDFDYATLANQIMTDADRVGTLRDAQDDYEGARASVDYTSVLLNAPLVESRYLGRIKGTVVAEAALFALGNLHFEFDPVFTETNVLPLLKTAIVSGE